jgi:hypothetical protein
MEDSDLLNLICGNGGSQVDVVLYLLSPSKSPTSISQQC